MFLFKINKYIILLAIFSLFYFTLGIIYYNIVQTGSFPICDMERVTLVVSILRYTKSQNIYIF